MQTHSPKLQSPWFFWWSISLPSRCNKHWSCFASVTCQSNVSHDANWWKANIWVDKKDTEQLYDKQHFKSNHQLKKYKMYHWYQYQYLEASLIVFGGIWNKELVYFKHTKHSLRRTQKFAMNSKTHSSLAFHPHHHHHHHDWRGFSTNYSMLVKTGKRSLSWMNTKYFQDSSVNTKISNDIMITQA